MRCSNKVCNGCTDRRIGCNSDCEKYLAEAERIRKEKDTIYQQKVKELGWRGYLTENKRTRKRRMGEK